MSDAPAGVGLADPGVQLLDANGDGRMDLMATTDRLSCYYPMSFDGSQDRKSFQPFQMTPSFNLKEPEVHMVDLDGDSVTDAIRSGTRLECYFNDPQLTSKSFALADCRGHRQFAGTLLVRQLVAAFDGYCTTTFGVDGN